MPQRRASIERLGARESPRELEGSARDFAWLYAPPRLRAVLGPLLDIEREVGAALRSGLDHTVAHVRLAWWREECGRCARGQSVHPAGRALLAATGRPVDPIGLIETTEWDLAAATFETRVEVTNYCERWASAVPEIAARSAPSADGTDTCARFGRSLGVALKEIELLVGLARDARAGRLRLPLDELGQAGVEPSELARPPWSGALKRLIEHRHRAARTVLAESIAALPAAQQPSLRGLIVWAALAHRASRRAARALSSEGRAGDAQRVTGRIGRIADAWLAWRAARLADRGIFRLERENRI